MNDRLSKLRKPKRHNHTPIPTITAAIAEVMKILRLSIGRSGALPA
jgi:hypothetical protein